MAFRPFNTMLNWRHDHPDDFAEAVVTKTYDVYDVAIKAGYFSIAVAALLFVSMILLTGLHP